MSDNILAAYMLSQARQRQPNQSTASRLAAQMMANAGPRGPVWGTAPLIAGLANGLVAGLLARQGEQDDRVHEKVNFGRIQDLVEGQRAQSQQALQSMFGQPPAAAPPAVNPLLGGMPTMAPPREPGEPPYGRNGDPGLNDPRADPNYNPVAASGAGNNAVPGRPAIGAQQTRLPENAGPYRLGPDGRPIIGPDGLPEENPWHAARGQLPRPNGQINPNVGALATIPNNPLAGLPPVGPGNPLAAPLAPPARGQVPQFVPEPFVYGGRTPDMNAVAAALNSPDASVRTTASAIMSAYQAHQQRQDARRLALEDRAFALLNQPLMTVSPGQAVVDRNNPTQPLFTAPERENPDLIRWRALTDLGERATPSQVQERDILAQRLRGAGVNVNLDNRQEGALIRADADTLKAVNEGANQALALRQLFDRAAVAVQNTPEGAGAQFAPIIGQAARSLGFDIPGTSEAEVLRSLTNQLASLQRMPGSGATSDRDMALYLQAVPRLGNTREGNMQLIDFGRRLMDRRIQEARVFRENVGRQDLFDRLSALGPVFTDEERAALVGNARPAQGAIQQGIALPGGGTAVPPPPAPPQGGGWSIRPVR